jgi:hypothetical protein
VTARILEKIDTEDDLRGFEDLKEEDKERIRNAIKDKKVVSEAAAEEPEEKQNATSTPSTKSKSTTRKRKKAEEKPDAVEGKVKPEPKKKTRRKKVQEVGDNKE